MNPKNPTHANPTHANPRKPPEAADVPATAPDDVKERDVTLETFEQKVERASVESLAGHPEGSAPPLERLVDAKISNDHERR